MLLGFFQAIDQTRGGKELGLITRPARGQPQSDADVRLPSPRLTYKTDIEMFGDPLPTG
jgi:hypothetical protein